MPYKTINLASIIITSFCLGYATKIYNGSINCKAAIIILAFGLIAGILVMIIHKQTPPKE